MHFIFWFYLSISLHLLGRSGILCFWQPALTGRHHDMLCAPPVLQPNCFYFYRDEVQQPRSSKANWLPNRRRKTQPETMQSTPT